MTQPAGLSPAINHKIERFCLETLDCIPACIPTQATTPVAAAKRLTAWLNELEIA